MNRLPTLTLCVVLATALSGAAWSQSTMNNGGKMQHSGKMGGSMGQGGAMNDGGQMPNNGGMGQGGMMGQNGMMGQGGMMMQGTFMMYGTMMGQAGMGQPNGAMMGQQSGMGQQAAQAGGDPTKPGQGAFAAVSEIVAMLRADPETDWSAVDIGALREHLLDMDLLVTQTEVTATQIDGGLQMVVGLSGRAGAAVGRMVPGHSPVLEGETGWTSEVDVQPDQITWRVTSDKDTTQIRALGFYGLMSMGDHHRLHHMMLATGQMDAM